MGVDLTSTGAWDEHNRKVLDNGRKKVNRVISMCSQVVVAGSIYIVRPTLEYGSEVLEANKSLADTLKVTFYVCKAVSGVHRSNGIRKNREQIKEGYS